MAKESQFFMRRLWSNLYLINALVFLLLGGQLFTSSAGWRTVLYAPVFAFGAWFLYVAWSARRRPMITIGEEAIETRTLLTRASTRIRRNDVLGVAWANPGALGLRLNSGDTASINLVGLTPSDKAAIHELLGPRRSGA